MMQQIKEAIAAQIKAAGATLTEIKVTEQQDDAYTTRFSFAVNCNIQLETLEEKREEGKLYALNRQIRAQIREILNAHGVSDKGFSFAIDFPPFTYPFVDTSNSATATANFQKARKTHTANTVVPCTLHFSLFNFAEARLTAEHLTTLEPKEFPGLNGRVKVGHADFYDKPNTANYPAARFLDGRYDACVVHSKDSNLYAVGAGPAVDQSKDRGLGDRNITLFYQSLLDLAAKHQKQIVIMAWARLGTEVFPYLNANQFGDITVSSEKIEQESTLGIDVYQLRVNETAIKVLCIKNMPDNQCVVLTEQDITRIHSAYNANDTIFFHHCKEGAGRSAAMCLANVQYKTWPEMLLSLTSKSMATVDDLVTKALDYFRLFRENRHVESFPYQTQQSIELACKLSSCELARLAANQDIPVLLPKDINVVEQIAYLKTLINNWKSHGSSAQDRGIAEQQIFLLTKKIIDLVCAQNNLPTPAIFKTINDAATMQATITAFINRYQDNYLQHKAETKNKAALGLKQHVLPLLPSTAPTVTNSVALKTV
jgi:hypothetical protein